MRGHAIGNCRILGLSASLAWTSLPAIANVVGGDLQNFNAVPGGIDYVTVESSETLEPGYLNFGLMLNHAVNSLPYYEDSAQTRVRYNDALTMADIGIGLGVLPRFEIGMAIQDLLVQQVSATSAHGEFSGPGVTNYRGYGKYRLLHAHRVGLAFVGGAVFNNVDNNPVVGNRGSPVGIAQLAVDTKVHSLAMAANVGYRFRRRGDPIPGMHLQPMGNQYIGSLGLSYLVPALDTKLIVELFGSRPAGQTNSGMEVRQSSSAELLAGVKFDATTHIAVHMGGGTELIRGAATPDWRAYAGLNWALGPLVRHRPLEERILQPTTVATEERATIHNIHFATGSDQMPVDGEGDLVLLGQQLRGVAYDQIVVEGHTDSVGSIAYNQELSERRAATVRQWLIDHAGIDARRIQSVGYGPSQPIADNGNFQGRQHNRRVEVLVKRQGAVLEKTHELMGPPAPPRLPRAPAP